MIKTISITAIAVSIFWTVVLFKQNKKADRMYAKDTSYLNIMYQEEIKRIKENCK